MAYGRPRPLALVRIFLIIAFVALLIYGYVADWRPHDLDDIRKSAERLGSTAPFVAVIAQAVGVVFLIPGFLLIIATALLFGNASIWISILGQGLGATLCYLVGRTLGHDFVRAMLGPRMITIEALLEEHAFRYLLYLHFLWLIPLPLVTYGPGLVRVKYRDFIAATLLGEVPFIIVMAIFGASLAEIRRPSDVLEVEFLVPALVLVGLVSIPLGITMLVRRRRSAPPGDRPETPPSI